MEVKTIFRIVEFIICVILFILWAVFEGFAARATLAMLICGTIFGFMFITTRLAFREFIAVNEIIDHLVGATILCLVCGGLTVGFLPDDKDGRLTHFIAAALFFANGVIFLIDFIIELNK